MKSLMYMYDCEGAGYDVVVYSTRDLSLSHVMLAGKPSCINEVIFLVSDCPIEKM